MVMIGTGGLLTTLTAPGSGTLAGNAHADVFETLSRSDARRISELMTNQLVTPWLAKQFPDAPTLAYWELAFREEVDGADVIKDAQGLKGAGFSMDPADLEEKTGYKVQPDASAPPEDRNVLAGALRGPAVASEEDSGVSTLKNSERPLKLENKPSMAAKLAKVFRMLGFSAEVQRESEWADLLAEAVAEGMERGGEELSSQEVEEIRNTNCGIGKDGFQPGNQCGKKEGELRAAVREAIRASETSVKPVSIGRVDDGFRAQAKTAGFDIPENAEVQFEAGRFKHFVKGEDHPVTQEILIENLPRLLSSPDRIYKSRSKSSVKSRGDRIAAEIDLDATHKLVIEMSFGKRRLSKGQPPVLRPVSYQIKNREVSASPVPLLRMDLPEELTPGAREDSQPTN